MLTKENKLYLAQLVNERKDILFPPFNMKLTNHVKLTAWEEIRTALMARGAIIKDAKFLRDREWSNLSRQVVGRYRTLLRTGQAESSLSQLDNLVLDIEGRESVNVKALNIPDNKVTFGNAAKNLPTLEVEGTTIETDDIQFVLETDDFEHPELSSSQISYDASLYVAEVQTQKDDPRKIKSTKNRQSSTVSASIDGTSLQGSTMLLAPGPSSIALPSMTSATSSSSPSSIAVASSTGAGSSNPGQSVGSLPAANTTVDDEPNASQRKRGKKKDTKVSVLSDLSFIEGKNKKMKLEIDSLQIKSATLEEREALELELLRSKIAEVNSRRQFFDTKIAEVNSRRQFFDTLATVIKNKQSLSVIENIFNENED